MKAVTSRISGREISFVRGSLAGRMKNATKLEFDTMAVRQLQSRVFSTKWSVRQVPFL